MIESAYYVTAIRERWLYGIRAERIECSCGHVGKWRTFDRPTFAVRAMKRHAATHLPKDCPPSDRGGSRD